MNLWSFHNDVICFMLNIMIRHNWCFRTWQWHILVLDTQEITVKNIDMQKGRFCATTNHSYLGFRLMVSGPNKTGVRPWLFSIDLNQYYTPCNSWCLLGSQVLLFLMLGIFNSLSQHPSNIIWEVTPPPPLTQFLCLN